MLSKRDFVQQSLELHLFFGRIMKEHSFFLELGFTPRDSKFTQQADSFRRQFDRLLAEVISLANGLVSGEVLTSGEVFTQFTFDAETASSYLTGVKIPTDLTNAEMNLMSNGDFVVNQQLERRVFDLNQRIMELTRSLINFKSTILAGVLACNMFTVNYPLLIDHIMREAKLYLQITQTLQSYESFDASHSAVEQELFGNTIMAEHAKFIRGLLDPTEGDLIRTANNFGNEFDQLTDEAMDAVDNEISDPKLTTESMNATKELRTFKAQGTAGLLGCNIKSIIIPLLSDHVLREANHYLRLLNTFGK